jgi:hypothetical protein
MGMTVAAFDRHLSSLTLDELRRRFDMNRMVELRSFVRETAVAYLT